MILRFFRQSHPASLFILMPIVAILLWIPAFFSSEYVNTRFSMPLYELLAKPIAETAWAFSVLGLLFNFSSAVLLNYIIEKLDVLERKSNLPGILFVILSSSFATFLDFHPLQPAVFFLLLSILRIFDSYQHPLALNNAFDAGFFLGIAILFYLPFFWFMPFLWTCLLIVRPFIWREYALSALGALLPFILSSAYYYFINRIDLFWFDKIVYPLSERSFPFPLDNWLWWAVFVSGSLILLFSVGALLKRINNSVIRAKSALQTFLVFSFFAVFLVFVNGTHQAFIYYLFVAPIAVIWSNYFVSQKKEWLGELLISIYLFFVIANQYFS
jgi:hypothetical protein